MSATAAHPSWCADDDTCSDPAHTWTMGSVLANTGLAVLVLSQPGDEPQLSICTDAGTVLVLPIAGIVELSNYLTHAVGIARGEWPEWTVA